MRKLSEEKRKALTRRGFATRHAEDIEGVLFAVGVLRTLRDRAAAAHARGDAGCQALYLNGLLNAVDSLLDKQPRLDDLQPCKACLATGRDESAACWLCGGNGERRLGAPWPEVPK